MITYLSAPQAQLPAQPSYRFVIELANQANQCDRHLVDVVVADPAKSTIQAALTSAKWLRGYSIVSLSPADCPF